MLFDWQTPAILQPSVVSSPAQPVQPTQANGNDKQVQHMLLIMNISGTLFITFSSVFQAANTFTSTQLHLSSSTCDGTMKLTLPPSEVREA